LLATVGVAQADQLDWVRQAGGSGQDFPRDIATDRRGNSYVTGSFTGVATFGPGETNETTLTALSAFRDVFIAKYSKTGKLVWVSQVTSEFMEVLGIAAESAGNTIITGFFIDSATFGIGETHETTLTSIGTTADIFVAMHNQHGGLQWAVRVGGPDLAIIEDAGWGVAVDEGGNSYVTGHFTESATFESTNGVSLTLTGVGRDIFVAKYDRHGVLQWATRAGGGFGEGRSIAVDRRGNSYVTGRFAGTATFGEGENERVLVNDGSPDSFVAKFAPDGALRWITQIVGAPGGFAEGFYVAADRAGNSYVTGWFQGAVTLGVGETNETTLHAGRASFFAKFDHSGAFMWARRVDTGGSSGGADIAVDSRGNSYLTGGFGGADMITFGRGEENETTLVPVADVGGGFSFVAKFDVHGTLSWARLGGGEGIAVDDRGSMYISGLFGGSFPVTFGPGEPNETALISAGQSDIFVTKHSHARAHRDVTSSPAVDDLIGISDVNAAFPGPSRAVIVATFTNTSSFSIKNPYFAVSEISSGAVLVNGDGPALGLNATLTPDVGDGVLAPGESIHARFVIRLDILDAFRFFVNIRGDTVY
jgi:hypothetical protein